MGSLDSATTGVATNASDNTAQEATLNTIRSISGDWDNSNVSTSKGVSSFTSSGTFTAPTGCTSFEVQLWGAGGGGAMRNSQNGATADGYGGGGGAYTLTVVNSVTAAEAYTVTIGSAGAGAVPGSGYPTQYIQSGSAGGSSSFVGRNVNMTSGGGSGGTDSAAAGGRASGGMIDLDGETGIEGNNPTGGSVYIGGIGGAAPFSGGRSVASGNGNSGGGEGIPQPGIFPGGGGSTRHVPSGGPAGNGGSGAAGFCIVRW